MFQGENININESCLIISSQFNRLSAKAQNKFQQSTFNEIKNKCSSILWDSEDPVDD